MGNAALGTRVIAAPVLVLVAVFSGEVVLGVVGVAAVADLLDAAEDPAEALGRRIRERGEAYFLRDDIRG
jgi:hypothetical protein